MGTDLVKLTFKYIPQWAQLCHEKSTLTQIDMSSKFANLGFFWKHCLFGTGGSLKTVFSLEDLN